MIDVKNIRIGNLFMDKLTGTIITVMAIHVDGTVMFDYETEPNQKWQAVPIPLSDKWLTKLGLKENKEYPGLWYKNELSVWYYSERPSVMLNNSKFNRVNYKHVHELQNLCYELNREELCT